MCAQQVAEGRPERQEHREQPGEEARRGWREKGTVPGWASNAVWMRWGLPAAPARPTKRQITSAPQVHPSMTGQFWLLQSHSFWDESASCMLPCPQAPVLLRPCVGGAPRTASHPLTSSLALPWGRQPHRAGGEGSRCKSQLIPLKAVWLWAPYLTSLNLNSLLSLLTSEWAHLQEWRQDVLPLPDAPPAPRADLWHGWLVLVIRGHSLFATSLPLQCLPLSGCAVVWTE